MGAPLASPDDVADMWRPLTSDDLPRVYRLIDKASALLRHVRPSVDARLALPAGDPARLDPLVVASVVAGAVKDFLVNPQGAAATSQTVGPYSESNSFGQTGDATRGDLVFTAAALAKLDPVPSKPTVGTIRLGLAMVFAYGETVVLHHRTVAGRDDYGRDTYGDAAETLEGVPVWPSGSSEDTQGQDLVFTGLQVLLPPGTDVTAVDRVTVYGYDYEVNGEPGRYRSPLTGTDPGVLVLLRRFT